MNDIQITLDLLDSMMSHGIFDSEVVAGNLRTQGWKFVHDPAQDIPSGGVYVIHTPDGYSGLIHWYNEEAVEHLTNQAGYFIQGKAPAKMFLAWIFARELAEIVAGFPALIPFLEGVTLPGPMFKGVYDALKEVSNGQVG